MIKDKLIEKYKELVKFYEKKLSMGEIHSAWEFRKAIAELEKQAEESSKGAEEILKEKYANDKWEPNFKGILEAMEQYRSEGLREECKIPTIKETCDQCIKDDKMYDEPEEKQSRMLSRADLCKAAYDNGFLNCRNWIERYLSNKQKP